MKWFTSANGRLGLSLQGSQIETRIYVTPRIHRPLSGAEERWLGTYPTMTQVEELAKISLANQPTSDEYRTTDGEQGRSGARQSNLS